MTPQPSSTKVVHAVCSHDCPDSCGVLVTVDTLTNRATKIQGDPAHPVTRGFLCGKVAKYLDRVYSPDRLLYPMRRKPGMQKGLLAQGKEAEAFERISWDVALDTIAARLQQIAGQYGPESILPYSYAGTIGQLGYGSMDRRFFHRLGASQLDRTICSSAGGAALTSVYGIKLGPEPQDFAKARYIIAWGANIHGNNIHLWPFIEEARRNGAKLVVIDPYRTRTAALADWHIAIRPGTDTALALSLMHVILRDGLENRDYIAQNTHGFEQLKQHVLNEQYSPANVEKITGITAADIEKLAREYAKAVPAAIRLNYGIQRSENGGAGARAVLMLPLLTGAWLHRGGGVQLSTSGGFPFNSAKLQMPELMLDSPLKRAARVVNMSQLGHALTELNDPPVKALFVYNSNPAAVAPDQNAVLQGMGRKDIFTVVHEQFFTDTADYADILLPACTFLETKDTQGAYGHLYAQISSQAIAPLGEAKNNVWLFSQLAQRMGFTEPCFHDDEDALIAQALNVQHPWFEGLTPEALETQGHIRINLPEDALPFSSPDWFHTPSRKGEFYSEALAAEGGDALPTFHAPTESRHSSKAKIYPLEFLPRKADNYMNSTFANLPGHQKMESKFADILEMNLQDAVQRNIANGDAVEIFNDRGHMTLSAQIQSTVPQGVVAARLSWNKTNAKGQGVNLLTSENLTDIGGGATFYSTLVEVKKLEA